MVDYEIVGVVGDTVYQVGKEPKPTMYFPILEGWNNSTLAVHTASDPLQFSVPVQKQIASLDPGLPVSDVRTMDQLIGESLVNARLSAALVLAFAVLSLLLASVGLYGVLSYLTTQRTAELGIRMALGAQRDQLLQLMLIDGLRPALFGLGLGLVMSFAATRIFQSMLFGTKPLDPAGSLRRDCDAAGGRGSGLPRPGMACFSIRSYASAPNRVAPGYTFERAMSAP